MADRFDEQAAIVGEAAGLRPEQWSGLAQILRTVSAAERERCAKIAEARARDGEHGTWKAQEGLIIEASDSSEDGAAFVWDSNDNGQAALHIAVAEDVCIDSDYSPNIECTMTATREQAIQLRDWLISLNL